MGIDVLLELADLCSNGKRNGGRRGRACLGPCGSGEDHQGRPVAKYEQEVLVAWGQPLHWGPGRGQERCAFPNTSCF